MSPDTVLRSPSPLRELRALKRTGLGTAPDRVRELLRELTDVLDLEAAGALLGGTAARAALAGTGGFAEQRIALLGSSTLDALPHLLTAALVRDGVLPEIRSAGFNQWTFEIMAGAPNLAGLAPRVVALLLDDAAVYESVADPVDVAEVEARCEAFPAELAAWAEACRDALGGLVVLCTVPLAALRRDRILDYAGKARLDAAWDRMNAAILDLAATQPATVVLSAAGIAAHAGTTSQGGPVAATDRMRHVAGHAFAPDFLRAYAEELANLARADLGRARKCLVLDLDNTLWGGVVGDDGVGGLTLGGGYPGSAYAELQRLAADLMRQGLMLAVCSKNDDAVAREAIATHPEMVLKAESFVAFRANWSPKPDNIAALAAELNIGTDAMVFVDDNPVERGLMRQLRPEVTTVELPADPASYAATLAARGDFALLRVTDEDRDRTTMYRAQAARAEALQTAGSLEDYLLGLGSTLTVEPLSPLNAGRVVQLFGKTNQFNLTGRRYSADEVAQRTAAGTGRFFAARLTDRFGDNGLVAAVALGADETGAWVIDNMVLSCRVFSRNVEDAIVGLVLRAARAAGAPAVTAGFVPTAKNATFAGFYPALGFAPAQNGDGARQYRHELGRLPDPPRWIRVTHDEEVFHAA
ncbi:MAG TPA: HAD-IIIC family phosphatase [Mycobacteriales bacterium]|nr:HAD-IIIC family phosphatase [Mycobacteriales bacterium]